MKSGAAWGRGWPHKIRSILWTGGMHSADVLFLQHLTGGLHALARPQPLNVSLYLTLTPCVSTNRAQRSRTDLFPGSIWRTIWCGTLDSPDGHRFSSRFLEWSPKSDKHKHKHKHKHRQTHTPHCHQDGESWYRAGKQTHTEQRHTELWCDFLQCGWTFCLL